MIEGPGRSPLTLITDPAFGDDVIERCICAVGFALGGALVVQLRDKRRALSSLRLFASRLRAVTARLGARLVINGDARLARDVAADGVHLGQSSIRVTEARALLPRAWVSVAAHCDEDVLLAAGEGADAVLVSPIFATRSRTTSGAAKPPRGLAAIRSARALAPRNLAVVALGGVDETNAMACYGAGADGVAAIRSLLASRRPASVAMQMVLARTRSDEAARAGHDAPPRRW